jgi:aminoglycoside 3-N-acetyltransferase
MDPIARLARLLSSGQRQWLRSRLGALRRAYHERFHSYDAAQLRTRLAEAGVREGDVVLMHSSFRAANGFLGKPQDVIAAVQDAIGPEGTLVMTSLAYTSSTKTYLESNPTFDVRRTPSQMGIITEIFRRQRGVVRSLSATHPILARGPQAARLVADHDRCAYPCGPGSPFERMLEADALMIYFDLPFIGFTFVHYIEHRLRDRLPFPLYEPAAMRTRVIDYDGRLREPECYVFTREASERRCVEVITGQMRRDGTAYWKRIGNTELVVAKMSDALATGLRLADQGRVPFDLERARENAAPRSVKF